jgi:hypothetical protein
MLQSEHGDGAIDIPDLAIPDQSVTNQSCFSNPPVHRCIEIRRQAPDGGAMQPLVMTEKVCRLSPMSTNIDTLNMACTTRTGFASKAIHDCDGSTQASHSHRILKA